MKPTTSETYERSAVFSPSLGDAALGCSMILHFDLDAFYASVAQRDDPSLRGKPLAVAGNSRRSVVLTASYEARPFGVRSALPLYKARAACPQLLVVAPDFASYAAASRAVFDIFADGADAVEGLSLDEAFVAIATAELDEAIAWAQRVRARVREEVGLTISAGVAAGKMVAKIASDSCKPDGLAAVPPGTEAAFLAPLPVGRLWGIGPKTQQRLEAANIRTIGDVAALDDTQAFELLGRWGREARTLSQGIDDRIVDGGRERKSISTEETFEFDVRDERQIVALLRTQAQELAGDLTRRALRSATIGIKIKRADFTVIGRQTSVVVPTSSAAEIFAAALHCWQRCGLAGKPIRLLGTRVAGLSEGAPRELSLFAAAPDALRSFNDAPLHVGDVFAVHTVLEGAESAPQRELDRGP